MTLATAVRATSLGIVLAISFASAALSESGRDWAVRSQQASFGYNTLTAKAEMTLYRGGSVIGSRSLNVTLLEQGAGKHDMGTIDLTAPTSLAGTKLLSWSSDGGDDQQWLATAGNDRARRIGDRGRRATFVNSDYTFEDLLKWQVNNYKYDLAGKTSCCTQVKATPTTRSSAYGSMLIDYDGKARINRIQYFRKGSDSVWKEQVSSGYSRVGNSWQPKETVMTNFETGTRTVVRWSNYRANAAIDTTTFQPN